MKKSKRKPLINIKQLERELRENWYNQWDIEEIMKRAEDLNEKDNKMHEEEIELMFSMKERVY